MALYVVTDDLRPEYSRWSRIASLTQECINYDALWRHLNGLIQFTARRLDWTVNSSRSCSTNESDWSGSLGVIWLFFPPGSRVRRTFAKTRTVHCSNSVPINDWVDALNLTVNLMSRKTTRLSKLDASVLEAQMRCGTEWPNGLVDAIAQAHQTTVRYVIERQRALRFTEQYNSEFNINF